ncbi:MAG TPA: rhodanese-like domain-containing protein [Bryobacteraceae bacterium]|jgi:membrane protein DedA with SNARE-associated domain/rhodanese-related sulfurtransferase
MEFVTSAVAVHGYLVLFVLVFMEAVGFPVPAAPGLILAGAAAARGALSPAECVGTALFAIMLGDALMYALGRLTGWWLLGLLCRISLNPEACILQSADSFYRRGRVLLVVVKFIPGINTLAAPLSGSMSMPVWQFLGLDFAGANLYIGAWIAVGFIFSDVLQSMTRGYAAFEAALGWVVGAVILLWAANRIRIWTKAKRAGPVRMIQPEQLARVRSGAWIFDVRSHGYYEKGTMRIQGSRRVDPNSLTEEMASLPKDKAIVLYCTCVRESTSAHVARVMDKSGFDVWVLEGGFRAWKKAGLPVEEVPEDEVLPLPKFA